MHTTTHLTAAVQRLSRTSQGRSAMRHLLAWLDDDGLCLDGQSKDDVVTLLASSWGSYAETARDVMREAVAASGRSVFTQGASHVRMAVRSSTQTAGPSNPSRQGDG